MRTKLVIFIALIAFLTSCSTNVIDYEIIKVIDHYEENEKNIQLGKDLLYYNYMPGLAKLIDGFNDEDAKNIRWEYFIQESSKQVSFRVKLNVKNLTVLNNREKIISYFTNEVENNYQFHMKNEGLFEQAVQFSNEVYSNIDKCEFEEFWSKCNQLITAKTSKQDFISNLKLGASEIGPAKSREIISKQNYSQPIEGEEKNLFILNFKTEYPNNMANEQLTLVHSEKWEVIGIRTNKI